MALATLFFTLLKTINTPLNPQSLYYRYILVIPYNHFNPHKIWKKDKFLLAQRNRRIIAHYAQQKA